MDQREIDKYILENYKDYASCAKISKVIKRSDTYVCRRYYQLMGMNRCEPEITKISLDREIKEYEEYEKYHPYK